MATSSVYFTPFLPCHQARREAALGAPAAKPTPTSWSEWLEHKVVEAIEHRTQNKLGAMPKGALNEPTVATATGRRPSPWAKAGPVGPPPAQA